MCSTKQDCFLFSLSILGNESRFRIHDAMLRTVLIFVNYLSRFRRFRALPKEKRHVCCSCGLLLLPIEIQDHERQSHLIKNKVPLKDLKRPSFLFKPLDNNKTYAVSSSSFLALCINYDFWALTFHDLQ